MIIGENIHIKVNVKVVVKLKFIIKVRVTMFVSLQVKKKYLVNDNFKLKGVYQNL